MDIQHQIAVVEQRRAELLTQAEHARLVRQLPAGRPGALARGYAAAGRALRGRRHEVELQQPIPIRAGPETSTVPRENEGPLAA